MLALPFLAGIEMPLLVRALLVFALSAMVVPGVAPLLGSPPTLAAALLGLGAEVVVGELLALAAAVVMHGSMMAGQVVAQQSGLTLGTVYNPLFDAETSPLEQLLFLAAGAVFIGLRGDQAVMRAVLDSFRTVPPLSVAVDGLSVDFVVGVVTATTELALRIAAPALLALTFSSIALGFLGRSMPQLNILSVGFAIKVVIGLAVMAITLRSLDEPAMPAMASAIDSFQSWLRAAGAAMRVK
jgi:flagellar biosynthetic protein FliR